MSATLFQQWQATATTLTFAEWRREQTVPAGLRVLSPVVAQPKPKAKSTAPAVIRPKKPAESRKGVPAKRPGEYVHGTPWGARRHRMAGEDPCPACDAAYKKYQREHSAAYRLRTRGPAKGQQLLPCGTKAAAVRHRKAGEELDDACKAAERAEWHKRPKKPKPAPRTHCSRGHELREPNLRPSALAAGARACLSCDRARGRSRTRPGVDLQVLADQMYAEIMGEKAEAA